MTAIGLGKKMAVRCSREEEGEGEFSAKGFWGGAKYQLGCEKRAALVFSFCIGAFSEEAF